MTPRQSIICVVVCCIVAAVIGWIGYANGYRSGLAEVKHAPTEDIVFSYGCGYVGGQHDIMGIMNVPEPHRPHSIALCAKVKTIAYDNGFKGITETAK